MGQARYAKTTNRSVIGIMNEFAGVGDLYRDDPRVPDLEALALDRAKTARIAVAPGDTSVQGP